MRYYNGSSHRNTLTLFQEAVISDTTSQQVTLGPVPTGRVWEVDQLVAVDDDNNVTQVLFFQGGMGRDLQLAASIALTAAQPEVGAGPFHVSEGRTVGVEFQGASLNDHVAIFLTGIEIVLDSDPPPMLEDRKPGTPGGY